jgi:hypothetical protein
MSATTSPITVKDLRRQVEEAQEAAEEAVHLAERAESSIDRAELDEGSTESLRALSEAIEDHRRGLLDDRELYDVLDGLS